MRRGEDALERRDERVGDAVDQTGEAGAGIGCQKLEDDPQYPKLIGNELGIGYRLKAGAD